MKSAYDILNEVLKIIEINTNFALLYWSIFLIEMIFIILFSLKTLSFSTFSIIMEIHVLNIYFDAWIVLSLLSRLNPINLHVYIHKLLHALL